MEAIGGGVRGGGTGARASAEEPSQRLGGHGRRAPRRRVRQKATNRGAQGGSRAAAADARRREGREEPGSCREAGLAPKMAAPTGPLQDGGRHGLGRLTSPRSALLGRPSLKMAAPGWRSQYGPFRARLLSKWLPVLATWRAARTQPGPAADAPCSGEGGGGRSPRPAPGLAGNRGSPAAGWRPPGSAWVSPQAGLPAPHASLPLPPGADRSVRPPIQGRTLLRGSLRP